MNNIERVVAEAKSWNNTDFALAGYGAYPWCASFVRYVFKTALDPNGELPVVANPPYYQSLGLSFPASPWCADSLAGDEVGPSIPVDQIQPGDLLFFKDTYPGGDFPAGTITHVGVCVDSLGLMADSSTSLNSVVVRSYRQTFGDKLVEARRPWALGAATPVDRSSVVLKEGRCEAQRHGSRAWKTDLRLHYEGGLHVYLDGQETPARAATADIVTSPDGPHHAKLFFHDNRVRAFLHGQEVVRLDVRAQLDNALHVWVNGVEVKPSEVLLEVVQ